MKQFCIDALAAIESCSDYGKTWVNLRMQFHRVHGHGLITSTWHGAEFFENVIFCIENNQLGFKDEPQGELKENFKKLIAIGLKENI